MSKNKIKHNLPDVLIPAGDICYPLFIPDDDGYRQLVLGTLSQLLNEDYYEESAYDLNSVQTVIDEWRSRVLIPFVAAMNDDLGCATVANYRQAERGTTQAIPANTLTKIQFQNGANPPQDWDVPASYDGVCTITARVSMSGGTGLKYARLLHNGAEIVRADFRSTGTIQYFQMSHVLEVVSTDVFNLEVYSLQATTVQIADFTPKISMVIV